MGVFKQKYEVKIPECCYLKTFEEHKDIDYCIFIEWEIKGELNILERYCGMCRYSNEKRS